MSLAASETALGTTAFLALGSNLGDRLEALRRAVRGLDVTPGVAVVGASSVYENAAQTLEPGEEQPPFLNAVVAVCTRLGPEPLLDVCLALERAAGRVRTRRWAPRPLDVDLVLYGTAVVATPRLRVPHPHLAARRFVLRPLADLDAARHVPPHGRTVADLLAACPDAAPLSLCPEPLLDG